MRPRQSLTSRIYDQINFALWVSLSVFAAYVFVFVLPYLPAASRQAQIKWELELAADAARYCEKWGLKAGSHEHTACTMDVQEIREKVENHLAQDGML